ncbi:hypothetical protein OAA48_00370 [bacterium]|nr:hypothetical protein [bacterium]
MRSTFKVDQLVAGENIYKIVDWHGSTGSNPWETARSNAQKLGGDLAVFEEEKEQDNVFTLLQENNIGQGLVAGMKVEDGAPKWINKSELDWEINWEPDWNPQTYPNGYVGIHADHSWGEERAWTANDGAWGWYGLAEVPFIRREGSAYVIVDGPTWEKAEASANLIGGNLVSIENREEDEWLNSFLQLHETSKNIKPFNFSYTKYTLNIPDGEHANIGEVPDEWISSEDINLELSNAYWIGKNIPSSEPIYINDESGEDNTIIGQYPYQTPWSNGSSSTYNGEISSFNSISTGKSWEPQPHPMVVLPDPDHFYLKVGTGGEEEGLWAHTDTSPWETYDNIVRPYASQALYGIAEVHLFDFELNYQLNSDNKSGLSQNAVLGDSIDEAASYTLEITGESLRDGYRVESADITLEFDTLLFNDIQASDIRIGGAMPIANAVAIDNEAGTIRIAASSLSDLASGTGIDGETVLASINLDFDETSLNGIEKNADGSLKTNPLSFSLSANADETVFSKDFVDTTGLLNREIVTLNDLGGYVAVDGQDVTLYEAKINFEQQGDGLVLGTQRVIGADGAFTNLIRSGDTLTTSVDWLNVGNIQANNLSYSEVSNQNATLESAAFSQTNVASGSFIDGVFVEDARESTTLTADIKVTGQAGNVLDLSDGILSLKADGSNRTFTNTEGSSNLITYQGDLNYDGRVSMKDLAFLNAGAARQQTSLLDVVPNQEDQNNDGIIDASVAHDVDADFSGKIDLADLSVLDADWGKTLHTGDEQFHGSAPVQDSAAVSWIELDSQGDNSTWDNSSFKDQNAIEADSDYVGSLESPTAAGVIGADGNTTANDGDITGTEFQDPLSA